MAGTDVHAAGCARLLLIEDDPSLRTTLERTLQSRGFAVESADCCCIAEELFRKGKPDVVITDLELPDGEGLHLLKRLRALDASVPVVILTGHGSILRAVEAVKAGAEDFLTKPTDARRLMEVVEQAIRTRREGGVTPEGGSSRPTPEPPALLAGESVAMRRLRVQVDAVAAADCSILVLGETGTGKSTLARWLHERSPRARGPFVDLNCAALPGELASAELFGYERGAFTGASGAKVGLIEAADGGTLFLDEIGDLDGAIQAKLLKVLEDRRFRRLGDVRERTADVRLVSATHRDLSTSSGFRADLYYRISTVTVHVPALRQRVEDIPALARSILAGGSAKWELTSDAEAALVRHPWPGNARELRNVLERATLVARDGRVTAADLEFDVVATTRSAPSPAGSTLRDLEREHIESVLREEGGKVEAAARRLGISRSTLYHRLRTYQRGSLAMASSPSAGRGRGVPTGGGSGGSA